MSSLSQLFHHMNAKQAWNNPMFSDSGGGFTERRSDGKKDASRFLVNDSFQQFCLFTPHDRTIVHVEINICPQCKSQFALIFHFVGWMNHKGAICSWIKPWYPSVSTAPLVPYRLCPQSMCQAGDGLCNRSQVKRMNLDTHKRGSLSSSSASEGDSSSISGSSDGAAIFVVFHGTFNV